MKLAIIFLSCMSLAYAVQPGVVNNGGEELLADGYIWGRRWDSNRRYECQYVSELQVISCFRGLVECEASASFDDLSQNYEVFALGSSDLVNFQLYPRNFSDKQYRDCKVPLVGGGSATLGLYSSASGVEQNQRGLWIKDAACAKKLLDLVQVIHPEPELVQLANQQKVTIYGYVIQLSGQSSNETTVRGRSEVIPFGKPKRVQQQDQQQGQEQVLEKVWRLEDSTRRAECRYVAASELLTCFRGLVKCEASLSELKSSYEVFGLGTTDMVNYHLYPRNLTDLKYSDCKVQSKSGSVVELSLYPEGVEGTGLMVKDAICYQRIVDTLRVLNVPNTVTIEGEQSDARVSMMGYVVSCKADQRWGATGSRLVL